MPDYNRNFLKGGTFFFTVVTYKRYPIFSEESYISLLDDCFKSVMEIHPFKIEAKVILPNHLHTIWTLPDEDSDFSTRWKQIKGLFSQLYSGKMLSDISRSMKSKGEKGIWQRRFWEHTIRNQVDFNKHCDYIHYNPVKHGLASSPSEWKYSSFIEFAARGLYTTDWGTGVDKGLLEMNLE